MKNIALFFFIGIILQLNCHPCGTDLINIKPHKIKISEDEKQKRRLNDFWKPIKIKVDMKQIKAQNILDDSTIENLEEIFNEVTDTFSSILSVIRYVVTDGISENINKYCGITEMEDETKIGFVNSDIFIFPMIDDSLSNGVLAAAAPCLISQSYRPMAGIVLINRHLSLNKRNDFNYYMKNLLLHELTHVLGFHPIFFNNLNLIYTETSNTYINSPKALEKAKIHFGCNNIKGIQLENQGGTGSIGSHWESRYMLGDYMISSDYTDVVISDITLAVLEDTKFYKVNYYTGGLFRFGKNQGCSFLHKKCLYNKGEDTLFENEFCTNPGEAFCSSSHLSKGICYIVKYNYRIDSKFRYYDDPLKGGYIPADYCPVSNLFKSDLDNNYYYPKSCKYGKTEFENEVIGSNSICFESSISLSSTNSICYKMSCDKTNKKINIIIGTKTIVCPGNEDILINPGGLTGTINCPDYNNVCTSNIDCYDIYDCVNKKSTADLDTYYYNNSSLKQALLEKDQYNLGIKDDIFENKGKFYSRQKLFLKNIFLLLALLNIF